MEKKTNIHKDIGKIYFKKDLTEEEIKKINEEIRFFKRAIRNRKIQNKNFDDLSLRISELKNSIIHYENDINVLKDTKSESENLKSIY